MSNNNNNGGDQSSLVFYPFAYSLTDEQLNNYCSYCFDNKTNPPLRVCNGCKLTKFCDQKCQKLGWIDHKIECKSLQRCRYIPDIEVRQLGRIANRFDCIESGKYANDAAFNRLRSSQRSIMQLCAHEDDIAANADAMANFQSIYSRLIEFYGAHRCVIDRDIVFRLHCRDIVNRCAISDSKCLAAKVIGRGLYLDLCWYDHSCAPNAVIFFDGFTATLRRLAPNVHLLDRANTFYSYIDLMTAKEQRRKMLKHTWYFDCHCKRCDTDDGERVLTAIYCPTCADSSIKQRLCLNDENNCEKKQIKCSRCDTHLVPNQLVASVDHMYFIGFVAEAIRQDVHLMNIHRAIEFVRQLLERYKDELPIVNIYYYKLTQTMVDLVNLAMPKDYATRLKYHRDALECMRICMPRYHPALALHLRNMGVFAMKLCQWHDALKYLNEVSEIIEFLFDRQHPTATSTNEYRMIALKMIRK